MVQNLGSTAWQARRYLGPEDASQAPLLFSAQTSAAAAAAEQQGPLAVPLLPPGLLIDGLPAAVLSRCQARHPAGVAPRTCLFLPRVQLAGLMQQDCPVASGPGFEHSMQ